MLAGAYHSNRLNLADAWSADDIGMEVFRLAISLDRFYFLLCCPCFDKKSTQNERKKEDKLALFRQIFELFVQNCKNNHIPSEYMTIDKMLVGFRNKCSFRQYIPSNLQNVELKFMHFVMLKLFTYGTVKFMPERKLLTMFFAFLNFLYSYIYIFSLGNATMQTVTLAGVVY